jgi:cytochrome c-type biogenesis protein CcmH/NrfG
VALPHLKGEKVQDEAGDALVDSYTSTSELDKAARVVSVLLDAHPADTRLLMMSYRLYSDLASNAMLTLALVAPHSAEMHQVMARELARHGDEQSAIVNYNEAIKANPKLPGLNFELGSLLYDSSEEKLQSEAEAQFQAALAANPNDEKSQLMLGKIAERKGDLKAALAADLRAVAMQPDDSDACAELAKILLATDSSNKDQAAKARVLLNHAIAIDPLNYTAHYRLVSLDRAEGKTEEAKKELADYQKYKAMKDKLRELFHDMRVRMDDKPEDDGGMDKK